MESARHIHGVGINRENVLKLDPVTDLFRKANRYKLNDDIKTQLRCIARDIGGMPEGVPIYAEEGGTKLLALGYTHVSKNVFADSGEITEQSSPILDGMTYRVALKIEVRDMDILNKLFDAYRAAGINGVHSLLMALAKHQVNSRRTLPQFFGGRGKYLGVKQVRAIQADARVEEEPVENSCGEYGGKLDGVYLPKD